MSIATLQEMTRIVVPSIAHSGQARGRSLPAGFLEGKRVGIRLDKFWVSWDQVTAEWKRLLEEDGATVTVWRAPIGKGEEQVEAGGEEYEKFIASVDVAIVGLCNCGSCSMWAVHDAVGAIEHGLPTVVVATEQFEKLVRVLAKQRGHSDLRLSLLPYPLEGQSDDALKTIAGDYYAAMLEEFGAVRR